MPLITLPAAPKLGHPDELRKIVRELQGLRSTIVRGALANTTIAIPAIRSEDTILSVAKFSDVAGVAFLLDDTANVTIVATKATGTITISGDPLNNETLVVDGVTYTFRTVPAARTHVRITAGNVTTTAATLASVINAYENRVETSLNGDANKVGTIVATSAAGVVTVTSVEDGAGTGPIVTKVGVPITVTSTDPGAVTAAFVTAVNNDSLTVNGVTFTLKTAVTDPSLHVAVLGTNTLQAAAVATKINAYEQQFGTLGVVATAAAGVVTVSSRYGRTGNSITLTEAATNVAASGAGFLAGGTNTGGIRSTTDLSTSSLVVTWFDKR